MGNIIIFLNKYLIAKKNNLGYVVGTMRVMKQRANKTNGFAWEKEGDKYLLKRGMKERRRLIYKSATYISNMLLLVWKRIV